MYKSKFTGQEIDENLTKINNINVDQINEDIETLKTQTQTNTTDITGLTTKTNDLQAQVSGISTQVAGQQTQITNLQDNKLDNSNGVITSNLLADGSITSAKIAEHQVTDDKLETATLNKINKALQTPTTAPTATELVGVDTNKAQVNIGIGSGLSLENGTLKVTSGGGGGDGGLNVTQEVLWTNPNSSPQFTAQTVNLSDNPFNYDYIEVYYQNGYLRENKYYKGYEVKTFKPLQNFLGVLDTLVLNEEQLVSRQIYNFTENSVTFSNCENKGYTWNDWMVPMKIIGIKFLDTLNYSTEEQYTGKHWIDGKKIYQKTFEYTSGWVLGGEGTLTYPIPNINNITGFNSIMYRNNGMTITDQQVVNIYDKEWSLQIYNIKTNELKIAVGAHYTGNEAINKIILTLQYTKTTE